MNESLTIFYDGQCPLCVTEMRALKRLDRQQRINLVDLHQDNFQSIWPNIDKSQAMKKIHGQLNGQVITGLDVTYHAWRLVGKKCRVVWLNWPLIRPLANQAYTVFAKHRHRISTLLSPWLPSVNHECDVCQNKHK